MTEATRTRAGAGRGRPEIEPIGLHLTRTAKAVSRAFDAALAEAGGSLPVWLILVSLKSQAHGAQRELADAVGIDGATLTHHLNRMEAAGLVTRRRDPDNRRVHQVQLTEAGEALFFALLHHVVAFDEQLRAGLSDRAMAQLRGLLDQLAQNATRDRR
jgi:MarR family transcriptional regulator, transcriptional regulator for hemolysin